MRDLRLESLRSLGHQPRVSVEVDGERTAASDWSTDAAVTLRRQTQEELTATAGPPEDRCWAIDQQVALTHRNLVANACQIGTWASALDDGAEVMLSAPALAYGDAMTAGVNVSVFRGLPPRSS